MADDQQREAVIAAVHDVRWNRAFGRDAIMPTDEQIADAALSALAPVQPVRDWDAITSTAAPFPPSPAGHSIPRPFSITAEHIERQREFSLRTYGPGLRTEGVLDHIAKESKEVRQDPTDVGEWVDIIILGIDGAQRTGADAQEILDALLAKQVRNEGRTWPDWRTAEPGKAIEHDRTGEAAPVQPDPLRAGVGEAVVEFRTRAQAYRGTGIGDAYHNAVSRLENLLAETEVPRG